MDRSDQTPAGPAARQDLHDLRECLYVIRTCVSVLRRPGAVSDESAEFLEAIAQSEARAAEIIRRLHPPRRD